MMRLAASSATAFLHVWSPTAARKLEPGSRHLCFTTRLRSSLTTWSTSATTVGLSFFATNPDTHPQSGATRQSLTGIWIRDDVSSDLVSYDKQLDVMQIGGIKKKTASKFVEGLQLTERKDGVTIQILTVVPFFKITEEVNFNTPVKQSRRDKRAGEQVAVAKRTDEGMVVEMSWGPPLAGGLSEQYTILDNRLTVNAEVTVENRTQASKVVYRRNENWRPKFRFPSL